jgi:hypothetical protein
MPIAESLKKTCFFHTKAIEEEHCCFTLLLLAATSLTNLLYGTRPPQIKPIKKAGGGIDFCRNICRRKKLEKVNDRCTATNMSFCFYMLMFTN